MINIILCGGSGTRLWPLSRTLLPKQFVRLFDGRSLFQDTVARNESSCDSSFIISNTDQFFLAVDQLSELNVADSRFLLEPVGRNTAPAIALACFALNEDDMVLVTPSDHLVKNQQAYDQAISVAEQLAEQGALVTFGIKPDYPETGYGYIQSAGIEKNATTALGEQVLSFKEKPSAELAQSYIEQGNYYWNSGMFCFKAGVFLAELKQYAPEMYQACKRAIAAIDSAETDSDGARKEIRIQLEAMQAIPADSIDYAVMEKSSKVKVVPCDMGWSDLGSFDALFDEVKRSNTASQADAGNALVAMEEGDNQPIYIDSHNNLLVSGERQVALIDVDDLLVVDTVDALLIAKKGSSQKVKQVVEKIKLRSPELAKVHNKVHRPWGTYEVLLASEFYKIKRIVVKPGSKLSLQKHRYRNEHWVVVSGIATVTVDEDVFLLNPNESTYIKMGQVHRLENKGDSDLAMIEVQMGEYTGEDDIIRIDDVYGRDVAEPKMKS
ncbi:MAG: mannose-1-phosphate guanylyltransferase/mannose-6-phosphate isomerase [Porticoccaceae bacterium]